MDCFVAKRRMLISLVKDSLKTKDHCVKVLKFFVVYKLNRTHPIFQIFVILSAQSQKDYNYFMCYFDFFVRTWGPDKALNSKMITLTQNLIYCLDKTHTSTAATTVEARRIDEATDEVQAVRAVGIASSRRPIVAVRTGKVDTRTSAITSGW